MFLGFNKVFILKILSSLLLISFLYVGSSSGFSVQLLQEVGLAYFLLKVAFYAKVFSLKVEDLYFTFKPVISVYMIFALCFMNGIHSIERRRF